MKKSHRILTLLAALGLVVGGAVSSVSASAATHEQQAKPASPLVGFMIASNLNNRCLEVRDGNTGNGAMVDIWDCNGVPAERFFWDGTQIRSDLTGKCLDIVASNHENGAGVNIFDCHGWPSQQWRWDGTQIRSNMSDRCLEISGANWFVGATVQMWDCNGGAHQQWHTT